DNRVQFLAHGNIAFIRQHVETGMQEAIKLAAHSLDHGGSAVSCVEAANTSGKVDHAVAIDVLDDSTFGFVYEDRRGMERSLHNGRVAPLHQRLRARPWNGSAKLNGGHRRVLSSRFSVPSCRPQLRFGNLMLLAEN